MLSLQETLSLDDVLLAPVYSDIVSRTTDIDISVSMGKFNFAHPIIPAAMKSIIGFDMILAAINKGGLAILNRFIDIQEQLHLANDICNQFKMQDDFAVSIGTKLTDKENVKQFYDLGVKIVSIDMAHGDSRNCLEMIKWLKYNYPSLFIIAGNVATRSGAKRLWEVGADVVRCGVGNGSLCSTRITTGAGVPQFTALMEVREAQQEFTNKYIIADGGCKNAGDIVKSLCFADMVMTGNLFAGCEETPSPVVKLNGNLYKKYEGSSTHKENYIEGVHGLVRCSGTYSQILNQLLEGLHSGCSYQNAHNLQELKDNPNFIRITSAGLVESHPHDIIRI